MSKVSEWRSIGYWAHVTFRFVTLEGLAAAQATRETYLSRLNEARPISLPIGMDFKSVTCEARDIDNGWCRN
jgi:hypothetical protein